MAENKKYYYLKLKENFYDSEEMIALQNLQDGYLYSDILMKLYLRSLKSNGKLMIRDVIPYTPEVLAQITRHQVGTIKQAIEIFKKLGLIEILDNGAIYMLDIQNFIGLSSTEGDRKREYRNKINEEKLEIGQMSGQMSDKRPPEIRDKSIDINKRGINKEKSFKKPTVEEIETYCRERNNSVNPNEFYDFYESKGWYVGKNKMKDWKASVRTWENKRKNSYQENDKEVKLVRSGENSFHIGG